jgi:hypothetical protein
MGVRRGRGGRGDDVGQLGVMAVTEFGRDARTSCGWGHCPDQGLRRGAGDGNRTRMFSLGTMRHRPPDRVDLGWRRSVVASMYLGWPTVMAR